VIDACAKADAGTSARQRNVNRIPAERDTRIGPLLL
jgi:hypothetical protein